MKGGVGFDERTSNHFQIISVGSTEEDIIVVRLTVKCTENIYGLVIEHFIIEFVRLEHCDITLRAPFRMENTVQVNNTSITFREIGSSSEGYIHECGTKNRRETVMYKIKH